MFNYYPKVYYRINDFDYLKVRDICIYTKLKDYVARFGSVVSTTYSIQNDETPNYVSYKLYGTPKFDYIILMLNDIRNVYDEWPRNTKDFIDYIEEKYGSLTYAQSNYANYFTSDGITISKDAWLELVDPGKYYESYYDYEEKINKAKTQIKVMSHSYAISFEVELQEYLNDVREVA
jgi:hypothetical protein